MKITKIAYKIRPFFYVYLWLVKHLSYLNVEKGAIAHDVLIDRLEKHPKFFIKEIKVK
ncbi:hypothetical protein [Vagococcus fluvialis]|uniref:hypothetical protein n=1 Tax=Vagococcus fluvialis TaxID=2738 RepID=UPI001D0B0D17|nr:hypothetical protein [Vagococcus fluvialis]UDM74986.1 hypothetical protein K5K99_05265 [Vagococcus fluvialis]